MSTITLTDKTPFTPETVNLTESVFWDLRAVRSNMIYKSGDTTGWGHTYELGWKNPIAQCLVGTYNRYFIINDKDYVYAPLKVKQYKVQGDVAVALLEGRFISLSAVEKYLDEVERGLREVHVFKGGRYYERLSEQYKAHLHASQFLDI